MTSLISNSTQVPSPFRFDTAPSGEADVDPDQIAVLDDQTRSSDGWGSDGFNFKDILDIINPLQHIPVVSTIYRAVTGDEIAAAPRAIGGAVYGGPVGLLAALGNSVVEAETGSDIGEAAIAALGGGRVESNGQGAVSLASASPPPASPIQAAPAGSILAPAAPQLASAPPRTIETPSRETLFERQARIPPAKSGGFIPSDAAARAGLFGLPRQPSIAGSPTGAPNGERSGAIGVQSAGVHNKPLQSAPANALDRLIARSRAAQAERSGGSAPEAVQIPTDSNDVHGWMLRALGKYETMPKS